MCTPGCNEEGFGYLVSPREESAHEYLLSASRVLRAEELHEKALDPFLLQAEFFVSPSNVHPTLYTQWSTTHPVRAQVYRPKHGRDEHPLTVLSLSILRKLSVSET